MHFYVYSYYNFKYILMYYIKFTEHWMIMGNCKILKLIKPFNIHIFCEFKYLKQYK